MLGGAGSAGSALEKPGFALFPAFFFTAGASLLFALSCGQRFQAWNFSGRGSWAASGCPLCQRDLVSLWNSRGIPAMERQLRDPGIHRDQLPQENPGPYRHGWDVIPWGRDGFGHSRPLWHPRRLECSREKTGRAFPGIGNGSDPTGAIPSFPLLEFHGSSPGGLPALPDPIPAPIPDAGIPWNRCALPVPIQLSLPPGGAVSSMDGETN